MITLYFIFKFFYWKKNEQFQNLWLVLIEKSIFPFFILSFNWDGLVVQEFSSHDHHQEKGWRVES